jgi:hypothetical protein
MTPMVILFQVFRDATQNNRNEPDVALCGEGGDTPTLYHHIKSNGVPHSGYESLKENLPLPQGMEAWRNSNGRGRVGPTIPALHFGRRT